MQTQTDLKQIPERGVGAEADVAHLLDDMAALAAYWTKNRANNRTPSAIRSAMVQVCREIAVRCET